MENLFTDLNEGSVSTEATPAVDNSAKKEKIEVMKAALKETVLSDPTFNAKLRSLSGALEVINTLGFGDSGNIVVDKAKSTKDDKELVVTSQIIGYRFKNIGKTPVKYRTETWAQGADGKFVATNTEKTLAPGATCDLSRQFTTMFCAQPEISFQLANGKIIKGSKGNKSIKDELESYYFKFNKGENGETKQVNDDSIKLNVGQKVGDKWVVKPEFVEAFGFLNNPKDNAKGGRKGTGDKYNAQDLAANFVNKLIADAGL